MQLLARVYVGLLALFINNSSTVACCDRPCVAATAARTMSETSYQISGISPSRRPPLPAFERKNKSLSDTKTCRCGTPLAINLIAAHARSARSRSYFYLNNYAVQTEGAPRLQAPAYKSCTYIRRCASLTFHAMEGHRLTGGRLISLEMEVTFQKSFRIASAFHPLRPCCGFLPIHLWRYTCSFLT